MYYLIRESEKGMVAKNSLKTWMRRKQMGAANTHHRPLVSGIRIASGKEAGGQLQSIEAGTLTGLAIRNSDGKKFLVTNLHVMTGFSDIDEYKEPSEDEEMYQESVSADKKVGTLPAWDPDRPAWVRIEEHEGDPLIPPDEANLADVAMCELDGDVKADFTMHDSSHSGRLIIEGVEEPKKDEDNPMELTMLGQAGGERTVTVKEVGERLYHKGRWFTGLTLLEVSQDESEQDKFELGDSGAACLVKVSDNRYKMSCIQFARKPSGTQAYAFPASAAQDMLDITFGEKVVLRDLGRNEQAGFDESHYGTWQTLTDFSQNALSLDTIDASGSGSHRRWSGPAVPNTSGEGSHPWWSASIAAGDYNPSSIDLQVLGGPDISSELVSGRKWGFKIHVKRTTETIWKHVLGGSGTLFTLSFTSGTDRKTVVGARLTIPLTVGRMDWPAYFHPDNEDAFEVKIEGAPMNPPAAPSRLTARPGHRSATLKWANPNDASITRYEYRMRTGTGAWGPWTPIPSSRAATVEYEKTGLTNGTGYRFELRGVNAGGEGASVAVGPVTPSAPTPPPSETWGPWSDTGSTRGCGPSREKQQSRTSNLDNRRTRWVDAPEPETWGAWRSTGRTVGRLGNRRSEQKRTSSCGNTQTEWIQDPEPETWGSWSDTGARKIVGIDQWKEQARTSNYGNRQSRWVIDL